MLKKNPSCYILTKGKFLSPLRGKKDGMKAFEGEYFGLGPVQICHLI